MKLIQITKDCRHCVNFVGIDFKEGEIVNMNDVRAAEEMIENGTAKSYDGKEEEVKTSNEIQADQEAAREAEGETLGDEKKKKTSKEEPAGEKKKGKK